MRFFAGRRPIRSGINMGRGAPAPVSKFPKLAPKTDLQTEDLGHDLLLIRGCLTEAECGRLIQTAESLGFKHQSSRGPAFGEAFRDNDRIQVDDEALAEQLWRSTGLALALRELTLGGARPVGLNPNLRFYRYSKGQRFGRHIDESVELPGGRFTGYTLLWYLSGCTGGETVFYGSRGRKLASVAPEAGLTLLHRHAPECLEHEGAAVKAGCKYILRSDVVFQG